MKFKLKYITVLAVSGLTLSSCTKSEDSPGYEYMPDMYRSQAIEAYVDYGMVKDNEIDSLKLKISARKPAVGTIPYVKDKEVAAIMMPLKYGENDRDEASANLLLPDYYLSDIEGNVKEGKRLYSIFCQHCHGKTGEGDGGVVEVGGFNPPSPYNGAYKDRTLGSIFHTITYGKGAMGSHASQLNKEERWKVVMFVRSLQRGEFENDIVEIPTDTTNTNI